jgi:hypothetical protein
MTAISRLRFPTSLLLPGALILALGSVAYPLRAQSASPSRMLICESTNDGCNQTDARFDITWTFDGAEGKVISPAARTGVRLTIEKLDGDSIVIRGVDQSGPSSGLTALYSGSIRGNHINGTVQWSWPGHADFPANGIFAGVLQDPSATPAVSAAQVSVPAPQPLSELLVCENGGFCNAAWIFQGSTGTGTWFAQKPVRSTLTILRSDPDYISIRRTDLSGAVSATYTGSLRGDRYEGTIVWSRGGPSGQATGRWTGIVPRTTCSGRTDLEAQDAMLLGQYALMFKRDRAALDCYTIAAKAGDSSAETAVGLFYYQGRGAAPQDYKEAFFWLHQAADQGVYAAQRTVAEMYTAGQGTQRDLTLASIYTARADEQKHDLERKQDF